MQFNNSHDFNGYTSGYKRDVTVVKSIFFACWKWYKTAMKNLCVVSWLVPSNGTLSEYITGKSGDDDDHDDDWYFTATFMHMVG